MSIGNAFSGNLFASGRANRFRKSRRRKVPREGGVRPERPGDGKSYDKKDDMSQIQTRLSRRAVTQRRKNKNLATALLVSQSVSQSCSFYDAAGDSTESVFTRLWSTGSMSLSAHRRRLTLTRALLSSVEHATGTLLQDMTSASCGSRCNLFPNSDIDPTLSSTIPMSSSSSSSP